MLVEFEPRNVKRIQVLRVRVIFVALDLVNVRIRNISSSCCLLTASSTVVFVLVVLIVVLVVLIAVRAF